ncbi:dTDP-4-dehydrorhamnose reductase [Marinovum algicola]|uniref:dTDP-4-dehydrorhamnose reductase n=1 Tax=Marinovum algicola TaxID=42444 RepID=A0A975WFH4_9RHOB|nr:dTDP-4-dehydrorhamnose reductase [Marinovum algicola]SEK11318.1 dTDP-4-dehydrorhamnose reductase [Marinovum algicola]SLN76470.1 dTDP-4-dehydrorhamnose reductase [Marinovum algicola]
MILVFGKTGQVAIELQRQAPEAARLTALPRAHADLSDPAACAEAIRTLKPSVVINAAAYTAVDRAEQEEPLATRINGEAPGAMARACADLGIPLVHISTDYVFDGSGESPRNPSDPTSPSNAYGRSKLAGEEAIRASGCAHVILRTSWVFSAHGANFVKTMLRLGAERDRLTIVADQVGGPTPAAEIARACLAIADAMIADPAKSGTYHLSGAPDVSWANFAREIFTQSGLNSEVSDIPTSNFPTPAKRPLNSRMDNSSLTDTFGLPRPDWRAGLQDVLTDLGALTA